MSYAKCLFRLGLNMQKMVGAVKFTVLLATYRASPSMFQNNHDLIQHFVYLFTMTPWWVTRMLMTSGKHGGILGWMCGCGRHKTTHAYHEIGQSGSWKKNKWIYSVQQCKSAVHKEWQYHQNSLKSTPIYLFYLHYMWDRGNLHVGCYILTSKSWNAHAILCGPIHWHNWPGNFYLCDPPSL